MAIPNTYTPQQLEDVRKKMHLSRSRLKTMLCHIPGGWVPSTRLEENFHMQVGNGRWQRSPHCRIRVLRSGVRDGKKSCPVYVEWRFPVGHLPTVDDFAKNGKRAFGHWCHGVDPKSFIADIRDIQDASAEIPDILEMLPHIAALCHPDPLMNLVGEGGWKEASKDVRKKQKIKVRKDSEKPS